MSEDKKITDIPDKKPLLFIIIALGVALLFVGNGALGFLDKKDDSTVSTEYDETAYEAELTAKIENICRRVRGAGNVSVAVSLDGSFKSVLVQNMQSNDGTKRQEYVLIGSGSSESAVTIGYTPPKILGVGIVCDGGSDASVRREIIELVSAAFNIPTNKIYVTAS